MITTLTGTNSFDLKNEMKQVKSSFIKQYGDMAIEEFDASEVEYNQLLQAVQALPFLVEKRLIIISSPTSNKQLSENIDDFLQATNEQTDVVFWEPKFDKRSSLYKTLQKKTTFKDMKELNEFELASWATKYANDQEAELGSSAAKTLIDRVGLNQLRLKNEIEKLAIYNPKIDKQSIELLTEPNPTSTTFDLLDSALSGNVKRAMQLYDEQRKQKVEPQAILALLSWQLHVMAIVAAAGKRHPSEIASAAKLSPYVVRKSVGLIGKLGSKKLKSLINQTLEIDIRLKRESIDADDALRNLLISATSN